MQQLALYFILFIIYSFMGWVMEVIVTLIQDHKFVNRGFLIGPYCPIYGFGCLLIIFLLGKYAKDPVVLFFMSILICSTLEYMTSYVMEKLFNARWWDYSNKSFNINGRICLGTMIPFGVLGSIVLCVINPFYTNLLSKLPQTLLIVIATTLFVIFFIDNLISLNVIKSFKKEIKKVQRDQTEEISKKIRNILSKKGGLYNRLLKAFPQAMIPKEVLLKLQSKINEKINKIKKTKQDK